MLQQEYRHRNAAWIAHNKRLSPPVMMSPAAAAAATSCACCEFGRAVCTLRVYGKANEAQIHLVAVLVFLAAVW